MRAKSSLRPFLDSLRRGPALVAACGADGSVHWAADIHPNAHGAARPEILALTIIPDERAMLIAGAGPPELRYVVLETCIPHSFSAICWKASRRSLSAACGVN